MYTEVSSENEIKTNNYISPIMYCMEPSIDLFQTLKKNSFDTINLYIDVKNTSTGLFIPDVVQRICENGKRLKCGIDTTIFQNILNTIINWTEFAKFNKKNIKIFFINDEGKSEYHNKINPEYKANRKITNLILAEYKEDLDRIKKINWNKAELVSNKFKNVFFITTRRLESDFIPYYLVTRYFKEDKRTVHIISSNDKDHYQFLNLPNTLMFSKKAQEWTVLDESSYLFKYIKFKDLRFEMQASWLETISKIDKKYIAILMALCGDASDNVKGLYKIGEKYAAKMISDKELLESLIGDYDEMIDRVLNGGLIFNTENIDITKLDKYWKQAVENNETVTNAFKQISYEVLSRWLDKKDCLRKQEIIKDIENVLNNKKEHKNLKEELKKFVNLVEDNRLNVDKFDILFE